MCLFGEAGGRNLYISMAINVGKQPLQCAKVCRGNQSRMSPVLSAVVSTEYHFVRKTVIKVTPALVLTISHVMGALV